VTPLIPLVDSLPAIAGKVGHPARRPKKVFADRAYGSGPHRVQLALRSIEASIAERNTEHGSGLGLFRWVIERTIRWLHPFRRLRVRYERRADVHLASLTLECIVIRHRCLNGALR